LHSFCRECIFKSIKDTDKCPQCEIALGPHPDHFLRPDPYLQDVIKALLPPLPSQAPQKRKAVVGHVASVESIKKSKLSSVIKEPMAYIPFRVVADKQYFKLLTNDGWNRILQRQISQHGLTK
jgi:hypothetical protein